MEVRPGACGYRQPGVVITTLGWILIGIGAWLVVATLVGMLIGRAIRLRDQQTCEDVRADETRSPEIPVQNSGGHPADPGRPDRRRPGA